MEEIKAVLLSPFALLLLCFLFILAIVKGKKEVVVTISLAGLQFSLDNRSSLDRVTERRVASHTKLDGSIDPVIQKVDNDKK